MMMMMMTMMMMHDDDGELISSRTTIQPQKFSRQRFVNVTYNLGF